MFKWKNALFAMLAVTSMVTVGVVSQKSASSPQVANPTAEANSPIEVIPTGEASEQKPNSEGSNKQEATSQVLASRSGNPAAQKAPAAVEQAKQAPVKQAPAKPAVPQQKAPAVKASAGQTLKMIATAYGPPNINWKYGGKTYTGTPVRQGVIAVDPNVIPLGTKVWISGYRHPNLPANGFMAIAEDIGGAVRGNRIDIFINTDLQSLRNFGMQNVTVTVMK